MKKKIVLAGIMGVLLLFAAVQGAFAETLVADLGDVRIYSMGFGYFKVESDRARQSFPLNFSRDGGWIEIACSSVVRKVSSNKIGDGVKWVVTTYLGGNAFVGEVASKVASWAASESIGYLCGD